LLLRNRIVIIFHFGRNSVTASRHRAKLIARAVKAKGRAYAPYSGFRVGAALLAADGTIVDGCNVENSSYSLTVCAERNAVFHAVARGLTRFRSIAIASDDPGFLPPCGACRQVLSEFNPSMEIILTTPSGRSRIMTLDELFPAPPDLKKLARTR
jgi:cytidine deaminase